MIPSFELVNSTSDIVSGENLFYVLTLFYYLNYNYIGLGCAGLVYFLGGLLSFQSFV